MWARRLLQNFARGFAMGSADIVPGVSGGTVALLLGIYQRLVGQIRLATRVGVSLLIGRWRQARVLAGQLEVMFLVGLLVGIAVAVLALARLLNRLIDDYPVQVSAVFFGLVAASVVVVGQRLWRQVSGSGSPVADTGKSPALLIVLFVVSGAATFFLLGLHGGAEADGEAAAEAIGAASTAITETHALVFFLAGAVAICAMILPGISGALILLIIGLYGEVIDAVNDRDLITLALFAAGAVLGLALFSNVLARLLKHQYEATLAVLVGLMVGSLRVLWPWPATSSVVDGTELGGIENVALGAPVAGEIPLAVVLCLAAFVVVLVLGRLASDAPISASEASSA